MNTAQLEFEAIGGGRSQEHRLARYLLARPWQWVPMPSLALAISETGIGVAVHSRVAGARKRFGLVIEQRRDQDPGHSEYRYVPPSQSKPEMTN